MALWYTRSSVETSITALVRQLCELNDQQWATSPYVVQVQAFIYNNIGMIFLNNVMGNCMEMKKFNYMLEIDIFRNSSQNNWVSWGFVFKGLGVQKDTQTPCWLRPWHRGRYYKSIFMLKLNFSPVCGRGSILMQFRSLEPPEFIYWPLYSL